MATHNDITGDALITKASNDNYRNNYDLIFGKKKPKEIDSCLMCDGKGTKEFFCSACNPHPDAK
jgi:hypothetical protein